MKIETAPNYEDTSLEDRPSKTLEANFVNTYRGESSVNIGDNATIEIDLCRNSGQEWWLLRTVFEDVRVYKDFDLTCQTSNYEIGGLASGAVSGHLTPAWSRSLQTLLRAPRPATSATL